MNEKTAKRTILMLSCIITLLILGIFIMGYEYKPNQVRECSEIYENYILDNCKCGNTGVYPIELFKNNSINT